MKSIDDGLMLEWMKRVQDVLTRLARGVAPRVTYVMPEDVDAMESSLAHACHSLARIESDLGLVTTLGGVDVDAEDARDEDWDAYFEGSEGRGDYDFGEDDRDTVERIMDRLDDDAVEDIGENS